MNRLTFLLPSDLTVLKCQIRNTCPNIKASISFSRTRPESGPLHFHQYMASPRLIPAFRRGHFIWRNNPSIIQHGSASAAAHHNVSASLKLERFHKAQSGS
ncbi:hypothetical protein XENOCAPTIV_029433 [Xenoophorus captivus]|uniref:Uncharacterized protein n=1 Tax=Xenoophorus captivus TaxID=1517983 RepID=A0ABV0RMH3_9TELE